MKKYTIQTNLFFLLFAALWGASYPITKGAIQTFNPYYFVFLRFFFASIFMLPFILGNQQKQQNSCLKMGIILGLLNTGEYLFGTLALHYIPTSRCVFIIGTYVVMVPFIARIFRISAFAALEVIAAILSVFGLYILMGAHGRAIGIGDVFAFISGLSIALSIVYVQHLADKNVNYKFLTFYQIAFTCPIPLMIYLTTHVPLRLTDFHFTWPIFLAALFCGVFSSSLPLLGQMKLQKYTTAAQTALIFALEPVFATLFAFLFYNEAVPFKTILGGSIMIGSIVLPILGTYWKRRQ